MVFFTCIETRPRPSSSACNLHSYPISCPLQISRKFRRPTSAICVSGREAPGFSGVFVNGGWMAKMFMKQVDILAFESSSFESSFYTNSRLEVEHLWCGIFHSTPQSRVRLQKTLFLEQVKKIVNSEKEYQPSGNFHSSMTPQLVSLDLVVISFEVASVKSLCYCCFRNVPKSSLVSMLLLSSYYFDLDLDCIGILGMPWT